MRGLCSKSPLLALFIASFFLAQSSRAGTFTLTPTAVARFDEAFNPLPFTPLPQFGAGLDGPGIYQIDFNFEVSDLAANERGWADTGFDVMLMGDLQDVLGWQAAPPEFYDANGPVPGGLVAQYAVNQDAGTIGDLRGILVSIVGGRMNAADPRKDLGKAGPELLGSLFVRYRDFIGGVLRVKNVKYSFADHAGQFLDVHVAPDSDLIFFHSECDCPPIVMDAAITVLRPNLATHAFVASSPFPQFTWTLSNFAGPDAPFAPTLDPATGVFTWSTQGAAIGQYVATVTAQDAAGLTDIGTLTINVNIPEPNGHVLAAFAIIGLLGRIGGRQGLLRDKAALLEQRSATVE